MFDGIKNENSAASAPANRRRLPLYIGAVIVILALLSAALYFVYLKNQTADNGQGGVISDSGGSGRENKTVDTIQGKTASSSASAAGPSVGTEGLDMDKDFDALYDDQEKEYGTDPSKPDTDDDGLTDYKEAVVYKTDPLNPDTDGDGYKDGDEVKNGFNPRGEGKLAK